MAGHTGFGAAIIVEGKNTFNVIEQVFNLGIVHSNEKISKELLNKSMKFFKKFIFNCLGLLPEHMINTEH